MSSSRIPTIHGARRADAAELEGAAWMNNALRAEVELIDQ
jgi:hypothetical protein